MYERNPELADVSDRELVLRMNILWQIATENLQDNRVHNPLEQIDTLLHELMARHPKPNDQIVGLSTLNMKGETGLK